jgi:hypothetical protein
VRLALDGRSLLDAELGLASARVLLPIGRGQHALDVLVDAAFPSAVLEGECKAELSATKAIVLTGMDAHVTIDLYSRDNVAPFAERIDADVRMSGGFAPGRFTDRVRVPVGSPAASLEGAARTGEAGVEVEYAEPTLRRALLTDTPACNGRSADPPGADW